MKFAVPLFLTVVLIGCAAEAGPLQSGLTAYQQSKIADAERIFAEIIADPGASAADKSTALIETARIAWLIDGDDVRALRSLDAMAATGSGVCRAFEMRDRVLRAAQRAQAVLEELNAQLAQCTEKGPQERLYLQAADAAITLGAAGETSRYDDAARFLVSAGETGKTLVGSELSLQLGLLRGDGLGALQAWKDYFWLDSDTDAPQALANLGSAVPDLFLKGATTDATLEDRLALLDILIRAGFHRAAERYATLHRLETSAQGHLLWRKASTYLQERARLEALITASNRRVARGGRADNLERAVQTASAAMMTAAGLSGDAKSALQQAYGLYGMTGETGGFASVHLGHVIQNERQNIEQYGHRANVGFLVLDNMLSNGYESWLWDGSAAAGGWTEEGPVIVQIRPEYTSTPLRAWRLATDVVARREIEARQAERVASDSNALRSGRAAYLPGLFDRLRLQVADQVLARARVQAGSGDLRRAFLDEYWRASFQQSIFVHEGRHALDKTRITGLARLNDANLEYRAKLSEMALADYPRLALVNINVDTIGGDTAHGKANGRIMTAYAEWIEANPANVAGFDPQTPAMMQIDKLSDDQLRSVARALDPLANGGR